MRILLGSKMRHLMHLGGPPSPPKGTDHAGTVRFGTARESDNRSRADRKMSSVKEIAGFRGAMVCRIGILYQLDGDWLEKA